MRIRSSPPTIPPGQLPRKEVTVDRKIWVVVHSYSGIPEEVKAYSDWETAALREEHMRAHMHPEYDECGIFEVEVQDKEPVPFDLVNP